MRISPNLDYLINPILTENESKLTAAKDQDNCLIMNLDDFESDLEAQSIETEHAETGNFTKTDETKTKTKSIAESETKKWMDSYSYSSWI